MAQRYFNDFKTKVHVVGVACVDRSIEAEGTGRTNIINHKEITVNSNTEEVDIILTEEDTTFGPKINKATTYWYEIALNETKTTLGFDETGPAELILFPAKAGD